MAPPILEKGTKKRRPSANPAAPQSPAKKPRPAADSEPSQTNGQTQSPLLAPHAAILKDLASKYDVLTLSIISSTAIGKRVTQAKEHLLSDTAAESEERRPKIVLLYARTAEVCKMITVAEQCKRALTEEGLSWWQYNQMFDLPEEQQRQKKGRKTRKRIGGVEETVVEETRLPEHEEEDEEEESDSESDAFETMQDRFAKAVGPTPSGRKTKSLRIFLSTAAVPEVRSREDVTVQSSQD